MKIRDFGIFLGRVTRLKTKEYKISGTSKKFILNITMLSIAGRI
jgi:hypothetical protein